VLAGVTVEIGPGLTLLLGPNGAGKSTLLKLAAGVERPDSGCVTIDGHDLWASEVAARRTLAYVNEQPDLTPYATIGDVLSLVCRLRAEPLSEARSALERCGLAALSGRSIRELSMGQRRRAILGAAWIGSPRHIVLDEPLEGMDRGMREEILGWVDRLLSEEAVLVVATHDIEPFADRAVRALAVGAGKCGIFEPLPGTGTARMAYLEALSRGSADFVCGGEN
jgi:ABC-type multidrug transport system ATPase subunit